MKAADVVLVAAVLAVLAICGGAMHIAGRDHECAAQGGHLRGVFGQECVIP